MIFLSLQNQGKAYTFFMKNINIQLPDWRRINWKSPINTISALSLVWALLYIFYPDIIFHGGIRNHHASIFRFIEEMILYSFLHAGVLHVFSNIVFFFFIGRIIEQAHGQKWTWYLWVWTTVFVGIFLAIFSESRTIGWSGFAMSLLAVYAYDLRKQQRWSGYKWALLLIVINLIIGGSASVSFLGHFAGLIAGLVYSWFRHKLPHFSHIFSRKN